MVGSCAMVVVVVAVAAVAWGCGGWVVSNVGALLLFVASGPGARAGVAAMTEQAEEVMAPVLILLLALPVLVEGGAASLVLAMEKRPSVQGWWMG